MIVSPRPADPEGIIEWALACRAGFEPEAAAEGRAVLGAVGLEATISTSPGAVRFTFVEPIARMRLPDPRRLIFTRTAWAISRRLAELNPKDRLSPLLAALDGMPTVADAWVEVPDGGDGAALAGFARSFEAALVSALRKGSRLDPNANRLLRLLAISGTDLSVAIDQGDERPAERGGVPRLRLPREAPSRSALKIEEAWLTMLDSSERERLLSAGMSAVDLGAAPGGWSWQLARRHLRITAIDNGPLAPSALATGRIQHVRADGFRWRPPRPVDWLVCDMVEQPARVARLISDWLRRGDARAALFNLKLPMKKRWPETVACLATLADAIHATLPSSVAAAAGRKPNGDDQTRFELRARQLYHDREEITVFALPLGSTRTGRPADGRGRTPTSSNRIKLPEARRRSRP
jgi:23S rRNA (cytidine2498-2'-O)-methyltransferase